LNPKYGCWPATLALLALLTGCAAQQAYREGQDLAAQGRTVEALGKFEEANRIEPGAAQYRAAVLQTRERYLAAQVERAETLRRQGQLDAAEQVFKQALAVHATNDRALAGLRAIDLERRSRQAYAEAEAAVARKDTDLARTRLRSLLQEAPGHEGARALLQRLDDASARPPVEAVLAAAYRKPITIEFKDASVRTVFEVISRTSGLNFVFDKDVRTDQKTSIFLKNSTIENAVSLTLLTNQLEQRVLDANTILIFPNTQAKLKDYQPLTVKSFYLANADAKVVAATLKALLKSRDVVIDEKLNLVILRDSPEAIRLAEKLVALHDVAEPEVMLEVEILEVKRTRLLDLGVRWPDQLSLAPLPSAAGALTLADLRNLNSGSISAAIAPVTINARKSDSDTNILANPRIRARNREKARILIGERVPNITTTSTSTGFVAESVTYVDVGLKLEVEPSIHLDGEVAIKVSLEVSNIIREIQTKSGSIAYQIGTRNAQTVLRLRDGENQVLAGLINDEDRRSANRVPGLGEVPVVGRLFGSQSDDGSKTEIVLSITPRIIRNVRRPDGRLMEFESGTENSLGARPTVAPAAPAPATALGTPAAAAANMPAPSAPAAATGQSPTAVAGPSPVVTSTEQVSTPAAVPGGALLRWQAPAQVKAGDLFAVQLIMQSDQPLVSVPLAIAYDPAILQATSVAEGDFLRQGGVQSTFSSRVDPGGQILITGARPGESGATAAGVLATINFRAVATSPADARVQVLTVAPVAAGGRAALVAPPAPLSVRVSN
jgi:general secretion pathway protein D